MSRIHNTGIKNSDRSAALLMVRWIRIQTGMQKSQKVCLKSVDALALNLSWSSEVLYEDIISALHAKYTVIFSSISYKKRPPLN
jgi:hypothetical protein